MGPAGVHIPTREGWCRHRAALVRARCVDTRTRGDGSVEKIAGRTATRSNHHQNPNHPPTTIREMMMKYHTVRWTRDRIVLLIRWDAYRPMIRALRKCCLNAMPARRDCVGFRDRGGTNVDCLVGLIARFLLTPNSDND